MQKHTPYHLLHKKLTGEINSAESNLLDKLMEVDIDAEYSSLENELGDIWNQAEGYNPNVVFNADAAFAKFQDRIKSEQAEPSKEQVQEQAPEPVKDIKIENEGQPAKVMRMKPNGRLLPLAASFLLAIAAYFLISNLLSDKMITQNSANTYVMEDGSTIWLHENSEISHPESFKTNRTIELSGEAYFQVAKSSEPFIVKTATGSIEAISTQFNVEADGKNVEVEVVDGSVELIYNGESEIVKEKQKAFNEDGKIEIEKVTSRNVANWRKAGLSFKSNNLNTVIDDLQAYFGVEINIASHKDVDTTCETITSPNVGHDSSIEWFFDKVLNEIHEIDYTKNDDGSFTINKFSCSE